MKISQHSVTGIGVPKLAAAPHTAEFIQPLSSQTQSHPKIISLYRQAGGDGVEPDRLPKEIADFLLDRQAQNCTTSTLAWYRRCLGHFQDFLQAEGIHTVLAVEPATVRRFLVHLQERGHSPGGVMTLFTGVKAFLNWYAEEQGPPGWNPLHKLRTPRRPKELVPPVPLEQVRAMLDQCESGVFRGDRDRAILLFLLDSGVRHQELTNLTVGDLTMEQGEVHVHWGKGRKDRRVFFGEKTREALTHYLKHRPALAPASPLWAREDGQGLSKWGIRQIVRRRAIQAGVPEPGLHSFRRAFAVNCLRNGMDVVVLQRLLGHGDLATINRYLDLVTDDLRRSHGLHSVVDRL